MRKADLAGCARPVFPPRRRLRKAVIRSRKERRGAFASRAISMLRSTYGAATWNAASDVKMREQREKDPGERGRGEVRA